MNVKTFALIFSVFSTLFISAAQAAPVAATWNELKIKEHVFLSQKVEPLRDGKSPVIFNEGEEFLVTDRFELEGADTTYIEMQGAKCGNPLETADFNILVPESAPDHPVTIALDMFCKLEFFVGNSDLAQLSALKH